MPAVEAADQPKPVGEELLWQALKEHIMLERQKKKEGILLCVYFCTILILSLIQLSFLLAEQAAEVEEERLRKEKEARDRQDAMTLGKYICDFARISTKYFNMLIFS